MTHEEALAALSAEGSPSVPIRARWAMGLAKPTDVVWTTLALPLLVSERVVEVLRNGGFVGWDALPVELRGKMNEIIPGYYVVRIRGRCGPVDENQCVKIDGIFPGGVFPVWKGLYFDPSTWDGADVFMIEGTAFKLVVEEMKAALQKAKVKNLLFEPGERGRGPSAGINRAFELTTVDASEVGRATAVPRTRERRVGRRISRMNLSWGGHPLMANPPSS
jgi:hypothetical protein